MVRVAMVPARGGSTRIPGKNLRELAGKPMCSWTFEAATECEVVDEVFVSTDSIEILEVASDFGLSSLGLRNRYGDDHAPISVVTLDFLATYRNQHGYLPESIFVLLPTCPFRRAIDIDAFWKTIPTSAHSRSAISVSQALGINPNWALTNQDGGLAPLEPSKWRARSQDLPRLYFPNGAVWFSNVSSLLETQDFRTSATRFIEVSPLAGFDIDEPWDLEVAGMIAPAFSGRSSG